MAQKLILELEARTDQAEKGIEQINKEVKTLDKNVKKTEKSFEGVEQATKDTAKGVRKIGTTLKAIGIGLLLAAFTKLKEVFGENQKIVDLFNTTFNFLSMAFNDFFNYLDANIGTVVGWFKSIFDDPVESVKSLGKAIWDNIVERIKSTLEALGFLASAIKKVFQGDFKGALEDVKEAGKEMVDAVTGVDDTFEKVKEVMPSVVKGIKDYASSTYTAAKAQTEANKAAEIAIAQNRLILEQKDREAETLRQIRDNDLLTIEERIEANRKLGEVLAEQEKLMLANADALIYAAEIEFNKNKNDQNRLALLEALAEKEAVLAQITGFKSEQLVNENSLLRENIDIQNQVIEAESQIAQARLDNASAGFQLLSKMAGKNRALQAVAIIGENASGIAKQVISTRAANALVTAKYAALPGGALLAAAEKRINNISLALGIASSVAATASALKALKAGGGASPGISPGSTEVTPAEPAFNIVGASASNQLADVIAGQQQQPIQAYVVSNDITTAQELDRNIIQGASIG
jgi:Mg2+ and Co2+ transporter CorA